MKCDNGVILSKQTCPRERIKFAHVTQGSNFIEIFTFKFFLEIFNWQLVYFIR